MATISHPLRILYVGNGNLKHRGARYYDPGRKLLNGLIRNGHNVYFLSDRDTARSGSPLKARKLGVKHCNDVFLDTCKNFAPEMILFGHADIITDTSLRRVRSMFPHVKMAQFNVDPVFRPHNINMIQSKLPFMDATFITTAGPVLKRFHHPGASVCFIPNACDASMERLRAFERTDQGHDVFWALRATTSTNRAEPRIGIPLFLEDSGKVNIDYYGMNGKRELFNAAYYEAMSDSKMGLNISVNSTRINTPRASDEELYLYSSDRISHYMANGLLTLTNRDNKLEEMFAEDRELVFFSDEEELLEKIIYYKKHEAKRQDIAKAGWEKYHRCYNAQLITQFIVDITFKQPLSHDYAWPTDAY